MKDKLLELIHKQLKLESDEYNVSDKSTVIHLPVIWGISLYIHYEEPNTYNFFISIKTRCWDFDGDKTDIYEIIGTCLGLYLRSQPIQISCILFPEEHGFVENEIDSQNLIPVQFKSGTITNKDEFVKIIKQIYIAILMMDKLFRKSYQMVLGKELPNELTCLPTISPSFEAVINTKKKGTDTKTRNFPEWEYYKDQKKGIVIIQSASMVNFFYNVSKMLPEFEELYGVEASIFTYGNNHYALKYEIMEEVTQVFKKLKDQIINFFFLENRIIVQGEKYLLFKDTNCGADAYKKEKQLIKERNLKENYFLFKPDRLHWKEKIESHRFEELCRELLLRESGVEWARKISHTNEADGGRDLIVEWATPPINKMEVNPGNPSALIKRQVIVQCKAYQDGVSKKDVIDIRDTIEFYQCHGYFLIVSSYLKRNLTEHLEKLRYEGKFWVDWWTKEELEDRLLQNTDLIIRYEDLFYLKPV